MLKTCFKTIGISKPTFLISTATGLFFLAKKIKPFTATLNKIANTIYKNHPFIADRLQPIVGVSFFIEITDLPFNILLLIEENKLSLKCHRSNNAKATLHIKGKFKDLVAIFEGNEDGDALFFSRKLKIAGNSEPLVCLRNAIDNEEINIVDEVCSLFGKFSEPSKKTITFMSNQVNKIIKKRADVL